MKPNPQQFIDDVVAVLTATRATPDEALTLLGLAVGSVLDGIGYSHDYNGVCAPCGCALAALACVYDEKRTSYGAVQTLDIVRRRFSPGYLSGGQSPDDLLHRVWVAYTPTTAVLLDPALIAACERYLAAVPCEAA